MEEKNTYQINLKDIKKNDPQYVASIFSTGNGHFGIRTSDPILADNSGGCIVNGFYEESTINYGEEAYGYPKNNQSIVLLPDLRTIFIKYKDNFFNNSEVRKIQLNMLSGELKSSYLISNTSGDKIVLDVLSIVNQCNSEQFLIQYRLTPMNFSGVISVSKPLTMSSKREKSRDPRKGKNIISLQEKNISLVSNQIVKEFRTNRSKLSIQIGLKNLAPNSKLNNDQIMLKKGETSELKYIAAISEINNSVDQKEFLEDPEEISKDTNCYWQSFWKNSDIKISKKNRLELGIHYNIFQLNQGAGRNGNTNIPAKGLSGIGYDGHYFWDTEIYMLPFFIFTNPDEAKKLLTYRYKILPEAKKRAKELGVDKGALFAWRTINGKEASAFFPAGTAQYHINADIAYAVGLYYNVTKDIQFINEIGLPIILETARFWKSFGSWQLIDEKNKFVFNDVTGPDEYTAIVNNNYYTNRMAQHNLRLAVKLSKKIQEWNYQEFKNHQLDQKELESFSKIADNTYLPYNSNEQIIAQDDSFFEKPIWPFKTTPKENYPLLLHYHPLTIYRYQVAKQPDALMTDMLFPNDYGTDQKKRNYSYYEKITTHDSSLSRSIFSILAARLHYKEKAENYFMSTALTDLTDLQGNTDDGLHMANLGGNWLGLVYGFAGLRVSDSELSLTNNLPNDWESLQFKLKYQARELLITLNHKKDSITRLSGKPVQITLNGNSYLI